MEDIKLSVSGNGLHRIESDDKSLLADNFSKIYQLLNKLENDRLDLVGNVTSINQELSYFRHVIEFQNQKIEKLTGLITDLLENKDQLNIINSLQALQDTETEDKHEQLEDQQDRAAMAAAVEATMNNSSTQLAMDSNMDPALSEVAQAAVQAQDHDLLFGKKPLKRKDEYKTSLPEPSGQPRRAKKPKIIVDFLHNPMTVQEIYDEFTKGFRGQPPLKEMDERYGKHEWRGDLRSKESKRFQRRKKLCDAIERGVVKFAQTPEEVIQRIEDFRGEKSLTWVMNGNLPDELL